MVWIELLADSIRKSSFSSDDRNSTIWYLWKLSNTFCKLAAIFSWNCLQNFMDVWMAKDVCCLPMCSFSAFSSLFIGNVLLKRMKLARLCGYSSPVAWQHQMTTTDAAEIHLYCSNIFLSHSKCSLGTGNFSSWSHPIDEISHYLQIEFWIHCLALDSKDLRKKLNQL